MSISGEMVPLVVELAIVRSMFAAIRDVLML
jgi:hypothetical protein